MSETITLIPDILEQNIDNVIKKLPQVAEVSDLVHIDIMDGLMVDNTTIDIGQLFDAKIPENLKIDMHLMVEYPVDYLGDCHQLKVDRAFAQIERMHSQRAYVTKAKELGIKPCLALDLHTPAEAIEKDLYNELDGILVMSVKAGWSGQSFQNSAIQVVKGLRQLGYQGHILMDGGMNAETICPCFAAGADQFAVNSYFWKAADKKKALEIDC